MTTIDHEAFFIGGDWRKAESDDPFDVISPRSEERIGRVPAPPPPTSTPPWRRRATPSTTASGRT